MIRLPCVSGGERNAYVDNKTAHISQLAVEMKMGRQEMVKHNEKKTPSFQLLPRLIKSQNNFYKCPRRYPSYNFDRMKLNRG